MEDVEFITKYAECMAELLEYITKSVEGIP
jgi:hypothetical protein